MSKTSKVLITATLTGATAVASIWLFALSHLLVTLATATFLGAPMP